MEEVYTKPFESVQAAIALFEQKSDPKKCSTSSNKEGKGGFFEDLSDCSLLLEAKDHEKELAFFEFDVSSESTEELLTLLKLYRAERDNYKEKFRRSQALFLEYEKGSHFFHSVTNLGADESTKMKTELTVEEENRQKFLNHNSGIERIMLSSQLSNMEAKKQSSAFCNGMEDYLNAPEAEFFQSQIQLELLSRKSNEMEELENDLVKQMIISEYLYMELKQSKDAQTTFSKAVLSAMNELDFVKSENEQMKRVNSESEDYILEIKEEGRRMKEMLIVSSEKINGMNFRIEMLVAEIQRMQEEMSNSKNKELEFQPNGTNLTSELHSFTSRISAIKESEARSISAHAGLNQAIQKLGVEAEEAKTEERRLSEYDETKTENEENGSNKNSAFIDADSNGFCTGITISMEEYEFLMQKFELTNGTRNEPTELSEVDKLKTELEDKKAEISELRFVLEETIKRAALAEKAEVAMETQLRKWRDQVRLRRAASEAVKEYCATKNETERQNERPLLSKLACINPEPHGIHSHPKRSVSMHDGRKSKRVPLGKLLKIKF